MSEQKANRFRQMVANMRESQIQAEKPCLEAMLRDAESDSDHAIALKRKRKYEDSIDLILRLGGEVDNLEFFDAVCKMRTYQVYYDEFVRVVNPERYISDTRKLWEDRVDKVIHDAYIVLGNREKEVYAFEHEYKAKQWQEKKKRINARIGSAKNAGCIGNLNVGKPIIGA